ncbi:hypothetical protein BXY39_1346 [Eilatimonas milleporae]|uniref:Uncharacterized protein n=1 Tax=Eilatimonas milleporae TaxID=911205 RepID=A0A3M0CGH5_9PROT|nr:hypothetical protein BXY39_1346 [Eilatimonas milleporae]
MASHTVTQNTMTFVFSAERKTPIFMAIEEGLSCFLCDGKSVLYSQS